MKKISPYVVPGLNESEYVIIRKICNFYGIDENEVKLKSRKQKYVLTRQIIAYCLKKYNKLTVTKIAEILENDHSNITHSCKVIENYIETNKNFKSEFDELKKLIIL